MHTYQEFVLTVSCRRRLDRTISDLKAFHVIGAKIKTASARRAIPPGKEKADNMHIFIW